MIYADVLDDLRLFDADRSGVRVRPDDVDRLQQLLTTGFQVVGAEPSGILVLELDLDD
jgi:hypothetical protein